VLIWVLGLSLVCGLLFGDWWLLLLVGVCVFAILVLVDYYYFLVGVL